MSDAVTHALQTIDEAHAEKSAHTRRQLVGGAAAALGSLGVLGLADTASAAPRVYRTDKVQDGNNPQVIFDVTATAVLRRRATGTAVDLRVDALPATRGPQVYEVWFVRPDGRVSAGTFTSAGGRGVRVALSTAARTTGYERIGITREPDGLDPARNGPNVLAAPLPR